jgi:type I restriction enzyme R subunit
MQCITVINSQDALVSIRYIYDFTKWFAQNYSKAIPELPAAFNEQLIQTRRNAKEVKGTTKGNRKMHSNCY